ncbi:MAG: hypothetical protein G01um10148_439 [Parcubacteria group bacterium Gr01-1014_8]|nr:MAG: hypothetical protein G01um10148_439 [Parcubacteria group bacterium Gr01-1014_8]
MSEALRRNENLVDEEAPEVTEYERLVEMLRHGDAQQQSETVPTAEVSRRSVLRGGAALAAVATAPILDLVISATTSPAEAAEKKKEVYDAARKLLATTRIHNGVHMVNVFHNGAIVPLGELNTQAPLREQQDEIEDDRIDQVFEELGFSDAVAFAERYNADFPHRAANDKTRLVEDANFVARMRAANVDIPIRNPQFINIRLAVMIWLASERLTQDHSKTFMLGGKTFNTPEALKVLPGLKGNGLARLLLDHELTPHLELMMELAKKNLRIPDLTRPSVPAVAQFIRAVAGVTAGGQIPEGIFSQMTSIYHRMSPDLHGKGTGSGPSFIYGQFIASPVGKQYNAFLDLLNGTKLPRNQWGDTEVTNSDFARALEKLPADDPNFVTINKYLPWWGN